MRIVWEDHSPHSDSPDNPPVGDTAWFSFGPVDGPDVTNHFVKLVIRFTETL